MRDTVREVFDGLISGVSADELQPDIAALPLTERGALLCTVCAIRDEVAGACKQTARQIEQALNRNCRLFAARGIRCHELEHAPLLPFIDQRP
jgi:hypothetical protein